jgi:hypothetical protein
VLKRPLSCWKGNEMKDEADLGIKIKTFWAKAFISYAFILLYFIFFTAGPSSFFDVRMIEKILWSLLYAFLFEVAWVFIVYMSWEWLFNNKTYTSGEGP